MTAATAGQHHVHEETTRSSGKLRIALIGCGRMGLHHAKAIGVVPEAELVAVADAHADAAVLRAALPNGVGIYNDPATMLREAKPDVVHVVTPPDNHVALASLALEHGAHVYVEKPFALTADAAQTLVDLARKKGRKVCAGHQVLFHESARRYREIAASIGKAIHIESYFSFKTVRRAAGGLYSPVDQLIDILPHPVYLMLGALEGTSSAPVELCSVQVDAQGEVRATIKKGEAFGLLVVTLRGRPVESYLRVVGTNGSIHADFVVSGVARHVGPGVSSISAVLQPFSRARQLVFGTLATVFRLVFRKHKSYSGLAELAGAFYRSILEGKPSPVSDDAIVETVRLCERIGRDLEVAATAAEVKAQERLDDAARKLLPPAAERGVVLVTGGTGFLGRIAIEELRRRRWPVRVVTRRLPGAAMQIAGVEYVAADISGVMAPAVFEGVTTVVHLAAETQGNQHAHQRNTVDAMRALIKGMQGAGVKRLVHISSVAVLKPKRWWSPALSERSPMDDGNLGRGPYVWAKAEAEKIVEGEGRVAGIASRVVRLGPLIDFENFAPPGRLGREVGPIYVAAGNRWGKMSLCDVRTAASVIRHYVEDFDRAPPLLNLLDAVPATRGELVAKVRANRPELKVWWLPLSVVWVLSLALKLALIALRPGKKPIDLYSAFSAERYDNALAVQVIDESGRRCGDNTELAAVITDARC